MKKFAKYFVLCTALAMVPVYSYASEITVKDTTSPEFIQNQGYSPEVSRIIEVKSKDMSTPISTEKPSVWKKFGYYVRETLDPSFTPPGKFVNHGIDYSGSRLDDL